MFSQCPKCLARFRVTAATLRAAHGRARCGHCGNQFDALERLSDELPAKAEPPTVAAPVESLLPETSLAETSLAEAEAALADVADAELDSAVEELGPEDYHFSAEDIEKVFIDARDWQQQYGVAPEARTVGPSAAFDDEPSEQESELEVGEPEGVEDITLEGLRAQIESDTGESTRIEAQFDGIEGEDASINDLDNTSRLRVLENVPDSAYPEDEGANEEQVNRDLIEDREVTSTPAAETVSAEPTIAPAPGRARATTSAPIAAVAAPGATAMLRPVTFGQDPLHSELRASPAERWSEGRSRGEPRAYGHDFDIARKPRGGGRRAGMLLAAASVLLAIAFTAQLVHYFRQEIARHPQAGPLLRTAYAWLGMPLSPNWDLDAFEVRQWGPTTDVAPGAPLTVRASLTNRANHAQPYPLLRLEFEDRFGEAVAQRDFDPAEYLKSVPQAARQLSSGETTEAELSVIAPGPDAVGYRLEICLREDTDLVRCAHGQG
jgi:predicted Zn finger-like uncharacterized protein